jgi:hypothetical protein
MTNTNQDKGTRNRDDEEEYSRVPIAGETLSDYNFFEDLANYSTEKF